MSSLSKNQVTILEQLAKKSPMSRKDLMEATGIQKGYSKLMGAQENPAESALEPLGYVKAAEPQEGQRGLQYSITANGKKALEKALKEAAAAPKEEKAAKTKKKAAEKTEVKAPVKKAPKKKAAPAAAAAE